MLKIICEPTRSQTQKNRGEERHKSNKNTAEIDSIIFILHINNPRILVKRGIVTDKKTFLGLRKSAQQLRTHTVLIEDPN